MNNNAQIRTSINVEVEKRVKMRCLSTGPNLSSIKFDLLTCADLDRPPQSSGRWSEFYGNYLCTFCTVCTVCPVCTSYEQGWIFVVTDCSDLR